MVVVSKIGPEGLGPQAPVAAKLHLFGVELGSPENVAILNANGGVMDGNQLERTVGAFKGGARPASNEDMRRHTGMLIRQMEWSGDNMSEEIHRRQIALTHSRKAIGEVVKSALDQKTIPV